MQEVTSLGEELLREPVKRVNHVSKLLNVLTSDPSQVQLPPRRAVLACVSIDRVRRVLPV